MTLDEIERGMKRLSQLIHEQLDALREQSIELAAAEADYRKAKAVAWVSCPSDPDGTKAGERDWTAARKEAWVDADTADLRYARDLADASRDAAREAVRSHRQQLSSLQSLLAAHRAEAELGATGPREIYG